MKDYSSPVNNPEKPFHSTTVMNEKKGPVILMAGLVIRRSEICLEIILQVNV